MGYGDFSDLGPFEVDLYTVTRLVVQCIQDPGFAAEVIPTGDGVSFADIPADQNALAVRAEETCRAGHGVREFTSADYTDEVRGLIYDYQLALRQCLIVAGYDIPEPPSREYYIENYFTDPWVPYAWVPDAAVMDIAPDAISYHCPQYPPGGLLAWSPGDPVAPLSFLALPGGPLGTADSTPMAEAHGKAQPCHGRAAMARAGCGRGRA